MNQSALDYTTGSSLSINAIEKILMLYLSSKNTVMPNLESLIELDGEMPMAHLFRGYLLKMASDPRFNGVAIQSLHTANKLPKNAREQLHSAALGAWFDGNTVKAVAHLEQLLLQFPTDTLALKIAHHLHFYSGDAKQMRLSIARVVNHYQPEQPFYGFVIGMHSFGLEESGEYAEAEKFGRLAVEINPDDQWAAHAVAHVMQMQSRFAEGINWTNDVLPTWQDSNNFIFHVYWHQALFQLGQNNLDAALEVYDRHLTAPLQDDFYLDVCNAASLLWRIEMLGGNVANRWQSLQHYAKRSTDDELIFCTLHYLMAPAKLGDQQQIQIALEKLQIWKQQNSTQAKVVAEVGESLAFGICDLGAGRFNQASEHFTKVASNIHKIGGSHAQRYLFDDMRRWAEAQASI
jgi:tetratricopeptide (TPR) repeat protein